MPSPLRSALITVFFVVTAIHAAPMIYSSRPAPSSHQARTKVVPAPRQPAQGGGGRNASQVVNVPLNNTGVADSRYLNPRRPLRVNPKDGIEFENRTSDRTFKVTTDIDISVDAIAGALAGQS